MKYKLAVFDMDGTILNTIDELADSLNYTMKKLGYKTYEVDEVKMMVGNGIHKLIERAVPDVKDEAKHDEIYGTFIDYYSKNCAVKTAPYPGIVELIRNLKENGVKTAVVSNKSDAEVKKLCEDFYEGLFDYSVGAREGMAIKPAPDSVLEVLRYTGIAKEDAVYIGDSDVDVATANNSGLDCIAVLWGFRTKEFLLEHGANLMVEKPEGILDIIL